MCLWGDEAFLLCPEFLKPYLRENLTQHSRALNYQLSRAQCVIENIFGVMTTKFKILQTDINLEVRNTQLIVMTCCMLYITTLENIVLQSI